ncbi:MAG TPA: hypothetical protein VGM90_41015 [Kofleriaceae bacterium]|jgi:hypothetical protein
MSELPANVRALMTGRVNTIEKLVVIAELGKRAEQKMLVSELAGAVPFDPISLRETLQQLQHAELVAIANETIELVSAAPDLDALLRVYNEDPVGTMATLSNISMNRIRSMAHAFADAFDLRKKR